MSLFRWAVGVTTVPERRHDLLPATLASLERAGFPPPRLFVDGAAGGFEGLSGEGASHRNPRIRAFGNWLLGLGELLVRNPAANRFLMAQDDVLFCRGVRDYLDRCRYPDGGSDKQPSQRGYWNLYCAPKEETVLRDAGARRWAESRQQFKGALALLFDRDTVVELLSSKRIAEHPLCGSRGWRCIDGAVGDALAAAGRREFVHMPSLAQHAGLRTTIQRSYDLDERSESWDAEFNAMSLL